MNEKCSDKPGVHAEVFSGGGKAGRGSMNLRAIKVDERWYLCENANGAEGTLTLVNAMTGKETRTVGPTLVAEYFKAALLGELGDLTFRGAFVTMEEPLGPKTMLAIAKCKAVAEMVDERWAGEVKAKLFAEML